MQFSMQIKHFFCIYPCILVVFFIVRALPEYPALPDERAARSVISGRGRSPFRLSRMSAQRVPLRCLEGTTERSDGNRVRSARKVTLPAMCLEGTTP